MEVTARDKEVRRVEDRKQRTEGRMIRTLQALTVLALISTVAVFVLCAGQWLQGASGSEQISRKGWPSPERNFGPPVLERFRHPAEGEYNHV